MTTLRIAAAQLHFHAAFEGGGVQSLREPTGAWEGLGLSGLRTGDRELDGKIRRLREQIERAYLDAFQPRLEAVIRFAAGLDVDLLVLPEYAVPLALLPAVVVAAGPKMAVVAGTHTVTVDAWRRSGVYERLGFTGAEAKPVIGSAVAPVIQGGRALSLQPKLSASRLEPDLICGRQWAPVPLGEVRLGVLACLDFLKLRDGDVAPLVAAGLDDCALLAVPALTPFSTLAHFERNAEELLYGYGRPIVYANHAREGGTRIFTPESPAPVILAAGRPPALRRGTEGVVVVDVRLGEIAQRYRPAGPSRPVAAAVLMDAGPWRELKAAEDAVLGATDVAEAFDRIEREQEVFRSASESPEIPELARTRLRYLAEGAEGTPRLEHLHALVRDVWIDGAMAPEAMEKGLVEGAIRALREVERQKPDAPEVAAVRAFLEQEAAGRLKVAPASTSVVEQVTEGLLPEMELPPPPRPGADGSFERWIKDPGEFPERLRREGFEGFAGDELGDADRAWERDPPRNIESERDAARARVPRKEIHRVAGLLALWGHTPAWLGVLHGITLSFVLRDGRVVLYTQTVPPPELLRLAGPGRPSAPGSAGGGPPSIRAESAPLSLIDDLVVPPPGIRVVPREIRALARHEPHLRALADFLTSPEGERFVEPEARLRGGAVDDAGEHLRAWLQDPRSLCLLLGDFGMGKSTTTRAFAALQALDALHGEARPLVFIDLRAWAGPVDLAGMVRRALGVEDIAPIRFAVECGECVLVIDGFDEMVDRLSPAQIASALQSFIAWCTPDSKVLLTCPTHLFEGALDGETASVGAIRAHGLGEVPDATVLELRPFDDERIRYYLDRVAFEELDAERAWEVLNKVVDLKTLARRPLLLDMIRSTLPALLGAERVAIGDLYEAYVELWAVWAGTQQRLSPEERIEFTEALARCIFRGDKGVEGDSVHWSALFGPQSTALKEPLRQKIASDPAAQREIQAGSFVVFRDAEGGGTYRLSHRSFLEYLVARLVVRTLAQGDREALDLPRFTPEVIAYCLWRPEWERARSVLEAVLSEGYRRQLSENALLLAHADGGLGSTKDKPWRLEGAQLGKAALEGARLWGAWLGSADLTAARLSGADLREARLDGIYLQSADLRRVDCRGASMRAARAQGAMLDEARFDGADLREARLEGSTAFDQAPMLDGALLDGANVLGATWREPAREALLGALKGIADARFRGEDRPTEDGEEDGERSSIDLTGHRGNLMGVAFSPDGSLLATACNDGNARIWEAQTGRLLLTLQGHVDAVTAVAFSPDGATIATASWDQTAKIWEAETGRLLRTLSAHAHGVTAVAFSPDGATIATASWDKTAKLWEARRGALLVTFQGHLSYVTAVAFSPDGARLATASYDNTARIWETATGQLLSTFQGHRSYVTAVAFSPDGARLATASYDKTAAIWEVATGRHLFALQVHPSYPTAVVFSPDGARIAMALHSKTAAIWDAATGQLLSTFQGHTDSVSGVAFSAHGGRLATASHDKTAAIWHVATGRLLLTLPSHMNAVDSVAFSPDGVGIATAMADHTARIWEAKTGQILFSLRLPNHAITAGAFSPDGARVALALRDNVTRIWDARTSELLLALQGHRGTILALAFSIDGHRIATASQDHTARIWEAKTGRLLLTLRVPMGSVTAAAFSVDGKHLVTISNKNTARIWAATTGQLLLTHRDPVRSISAVAFSADGARFVTGSYDNTAKIWETATGRLISAVQGHTGSITAVAFSTDGAHLATAADDHTTRVWETATGKALVTLQGHTGSVTAVAFSTDGARLATAARDHTARIWDAVSGRELAALLHLPEGGLVKSGCFCSLSGTVDLDAFTVRTGARCAPLALYRDLCVRPDLIAAALAGEAVPALSIPLDLARRRVADALSPPAEAPFPTDLIGPALVSALATFAARRDLRLAEHTLARCSAWIQGVLRAGSPGSLSFLWLLPEGLDKAPGFSRSAKVLLAKETEQHPLDLGDLERVTIPASASGRVAVSITFFLDGAERTLELSVTAFARNPYIVGSPITDPRDFYGRVGIIDQILAALEDDSVAIRGEIRIGKTSLLHQLARAAAPSVEMVSLQSYAGRFPRFLPDLARRLAPDLDGSAGDEYERVDAAVTRRLEASPAQGRRARLVLIIDEVQFLAHAWELRHQLRGLLQARKIDGLRAVVAGPGSGLRALAADPDASAFLNMFQPFYLEPMKPDEITRLVRTPLGPEITITDAAVERIIAFSGGRPLVAQILCRHALDRLHREERGRIDAGEIERVLHEVAFHDIVHNFYAYPARWKALHEKAQEALCRIAALPEEALRSLDRATLELLAELDLADVHQRRLDVEPTFLTWIREKSQ